MHYIQEVNAITAKQGKTLCGRYIKKCHNCCIKTIISDDFRCYIVVKMSQKNNLDADVKIIEGFQTWKTMRTHMHKGKTKLTWTSSISSQFVRIWRSWLLYVVVAPSLARWNTTRSVADVRDGRETSGTSRGNTSGGETNRGERERSERVRSPPRFARFFWYSCKTGTGAKSGNENGGGHNSWIYMILSKTLKRFEKQIKIYNAS